MGVFDNAEDLDEELAKAASTESAPSEKSEEPSKDTDTTETDEQYLARKAKEEAKVPKTAAKTVSDKPAAAKKPTSAVYQEGVKPDPSLIKTPADMRNYLMSFPSVTVLVPLGAGEKQGTTEVVSVNGVQLNIKKGTMVSIPKPFADQILAHYNISIDSGAIGGDKRIDGDAKKEKVLA